MEYIHATGDKIKSAQQNFLQFTAYNNMLIIGAAAICIGLATKEAITQLLNQVILPLILYFGKTSLNYFVYLKALEHSMHLPWLHNLIKGIGRTLWIFIVWIIILYLTYVVFKQVIRIDLITSKVNLVESAANYIHRS